MSAKIFVCCVILLASVCLLTADRDGARSETPKSHVAEITLGADGIYIQPRMNYKQLELTVAAPNGAVVSKVFKSGGAHFWGLSNLGKAYLDGIYTYELRVSPNRTPKQRNGGQGLPQKTTAQSGHFRLEGGAIISGSGSEGLAGAEDILHYDDVIITGSLCVGFDCADGESFGFDTIILKEHNLRIYFNDTSYTASYPTNNWRITINDSTNGGASYFSVDDVDDGTSIFKIEAGAPSNSLYVEDYGRVGLGTSTPVVELHIKDSDTPTLRLEQDSSGGWTAQTWDVAGNESNFFIRDATNGSKLPFRIQPSTPSSTLCLKSDGKVGIGTWSPGYSFEVETTGENAMFFLDRTDGVQFKLNATSAQGQIGTHSAHKLNLVTGNSNRITIDSSGNVGIGTTAPTHLVHLNGGAYSDGATWQPSCSRELKENISGLSLDEAMKALEELKPVKFNYKLNKKEDYVGFIAEDVPELVATKERKSINTMDVVAVLTRVVQQQQDTIERLNRRISHLEKK